MIERDCQKSEARLSAARAQETISRILRDEDPMSLLGELSKEAPVFISFEESVVLRQQMKEGSSREKEEALLKLTWHCLPQISGVVNRICGLGVDDRELVGEVFLIAQTVIANWEPVSSDCPKQQDRLRFQVSNKAKRKAEQWIANFYGLGVQYFPAVKLYFEAVETLSQDCGRSAREEDPEEIVAVIKEKCRTLRLRGEPVPKLINKQKKNDPWQGDVIARIHAICAVGILSYLEGVDLLRRACEDEVLISIAKERLGEAISRLRPKRYGEVLKHLYGFDGAEQHTTQETADHFGVSKGRIQQIKAKALKGLRRYNTKRKLWCF